jgi:hypothetical protein
VEQEPEKEPAERTAPQREEVLLLLDLLDREILKGVRSKRKLERDLNVGQGYLGSVLRGRITLKVEHLWDLADVVGFEPLVLLFHSAPKEHQERFLREMGFEKPPGPPGPEPPMTRAEIVELVAQTIRRELARLATS